MSDLISNSLPWLVFAAIAAAANWDKVKPLLSKLKKKVPDIIENDPVEEADSFIEVVKAGKKVITHFESKSNSVGESHAREAVKCLFDQEPSDEVN